MTFKFKKNIRKQYELFVHKYVDATLSLFGERERVVISNKLYLMIDSMIYIIILNSSI